ncbi:hypothetical protein [Microbulbifer elongatus]|uniref:hypothetical protein n=1 Tax=Microbulbifer elongatus TaxID=86173 RepID=UPI001CFE42EC|nr:hypothetical protein [Microbulbifer elongatus]
MTSEEYKDICSKVNAFRVSELEETLALLSREGAEETSVVTFALRHGKVEKPKKHTGSAVNDFCLVTCTQDEAREIIEVLLAAEAKVVLKNGETTAIASSFADLVDRWSRLCKLL